MRKITITVFFTLLLFLLLIIKAETSYAYNVNCDPTNETCDWWHVAFINPNRGTTWEVRYKYEYTAGQSQRAYPINYTSATKSIMVNNGTTYAPYLFTPRSYYGYAIHWATTCADPLAYPNSYSNNNDGIPQFFWNINIDPSVVSGGKGNGENLGTVVWTGPEKGVDQYTPRDISQCYPAPVCSCGNWQDGNCGGGTCGPNKRRQTRNCTPNACADESRCVDDISCTEGPIGGTVYIDKSGDNKFDPGEGYSFDSTNGGPRVQRGQIINGSFDARGTDNPNPNYNFAGLTGGTSHDIRVIDWNNNRLNLETANPRTNIIVPNSNVDFRFNFKKFNLLGTVYWDPDGIPGSGDEKPYVNYNPAGTKKDIPGKKVTICVVGENRCDSTNPDLPPWNDNAGTYSIGGNPTNLADAGREYVLNLTNEKAAHTVEDNNIVKYIKGKNERVDFYITRSGPPRYNIGGIVYIDNLSGGVRNEIDGTDKLYKRTVLTVNLTPGSNSGKTLKTDGSYIITDNLANTYTAAITSGLDPTFAIVPGFETRTVTVGPSKSNVNFLVKAVSNPPPLITGGIFLDLDGNGAQDIATEPYLTSWAGNKIRLTPGSTKTGPTDLSDGSYTYNNLAAGNYTVTLTPGTGYRRTYPSSDTYTISNLDNPVTCSITPSGTTADCTTGDATNVDFGVTPTGLPSASWIQGVGGDMRSDQNLSVTIPSGEYLSIANGSLATPGVIFNFNVSAGSISTTNWHVISNFNGKSKTSYSHINETIKRSGALTSQFFGDANSPCSGSAPNCNLKSNITGGYYQYTGVSIDIKPNNNSFSGDNDYVFYVNGDLNITGDITIPPGTTAIFVASGNITVKSNVNSIAGIFSADKDFIVENSPSNSPLSIEGSVIGNAVRDNANNTPFINNRDLGSSNSTTPSVKFIYRPDFALNTPYLLRSNYLGFREIAPQGTKQ